MKPLDRVCYWIVEREKIRKAKEAGEPAPWTDDPILRAWRFCNVRRMDDKVSRWLYDNWYGPYWNHPNMLYAVALARFVNLPLSLLGLSAFLFEKRINWRYVKSWLRSVKENERTIFNAAYMVRGNSTKSPDKIGTVVDEYVGDLVRMNEAARKGKTPFVQTNSMERTHAALKTVYGFGSFMAGQVVADCVHALRGIWADRHHWAPVGPGSARGLARILYPHDWERNAKVYTDGHHQEVFLSELRTVVEYVWENVPAEITDRLEMMDYQNCMCEVSGYEKVLWGEGRKKQRYNATRSS